MMYSKEITKKTINSQKLAFENGFKSMVVIQDQVSKTVDNFMKKSPRILGQTKSIFTQWSSIYKKGAMDFKETVDQNYARLEEIMLSGFDVFNQKQKNS